MGSFTHCESSQPVGTQLLVLHPLPFMATQSSCFVISMTATAFVHHHSSQEIRAVAAHVFELCNGCCDSRQCLQQNPVVVGSLPAAAAAACLPGLLVGLLAVSHIWNRWSLIQVSNFCRSGRINNVTQRKFCSAKLFSEVRGATAEEEQRNKKKDNTITSPNKTTTTAN